MALTKKIMGDTAKDPTHLLLNASVLVFLFRAIAGARAPVRREEVGKLNYWTRLEEAKTNPAAAAVVKRFVERQRRRAL